jgi:hypothetical protein
MNENSVKWDHFSANKNYSTGWRRRALVKGSSHQWNIWNCFHRLANMIVSYGMRVDKRIVRCDALQVGYGVGRYPLASWRVVMRRWRRRRCLWRRCRLLLVRMMMMSDADYVTKVPIDNRWRFDAIHATRLDSDTTVCHRMKIFIQFSRGSR